MRQAIPGLVLFGLFAAISFGCTGQAVVVRQDTADVAGLIDESVTAAREYYRDLGQRQFDFLVEFIAARPSCGVESPLLLLTTEDRCLTDDEKLLRRDCLADASLPDCLPLLAAREVPVSPDVTQPRQTTVTLLGTLASYQRALSKVLDDPTYDTAGDFADVVSRLGELCKQLSELAAIASGDTEPQAGSCDALDVKAITDRNAALGQQVEAAGALLDLLRQANEDRTDYEALRATVADKGPAVDAALETLLATYEQVDVPFSTLLARREIERRRRQYNDLSVDARSAGDRRRPGDSAGGGRGVYRNGARCRGRCWCRRSGKRYDGRRCQRRLGNQTGGQAEPQDDHRYPGQNSFHASTSPKESQTSKVVATRDVGSWRPACHPSNRWR